MSLEYILVDPEREISDFIAGRQWPKTCSNQWVFFYCSFSPHNHAVAKVECVTYIPLFTKQNATVIDNI